MTNTQFLFMILPGLVILIMGHIKRKPKARWIGRGLLFFVIAIAYLMPKLNTM